MTVHYAADSGFAPVLQAKKGAGRSSFGPQGSSLKSNAPNFSYGRSTRDEQSKMFLSIDHANVENRCREGPGHVYNLPGALDTQPSALKATAPQYSFSKTERMQEEESSTPGPGTYRRTSMLGSQTMSSKTSCPEFGFGSTRREQRAKLFVSAEHMGEVKGTAGPDPGTYASTETFGSQALSSRRTAPAFSMPKVDRLKDKYEKMQASLPPVGMYETWGCIGKQPLSTFATMPASGFSKCSRYGESNRFLSPAHTKENLGTYSPNNYDHQANNNFSSIGQQRLSKRSNPPQTKFGSAPRMVFKSAETPGPGSYE